ncbi:hypothetical protein BaOVIS_001990 [Babesia ovis]|uniref:Cyclin-dependent kinase 2 homolog n=1 Tax=Babesia ovis TaxID=5869 RepID=A0A9W5T7R6_BABOV|nr:hypothetical protein BaOVIS_001990 [Babesia ovis]
MGRSYVRAELSTNRTYTDNISMEGCRWPSEEQSPVRSGLSWCPNVYCEPPSNKLQHAPATSFHTACSQCRYTGAVYPGTPCEVHTRIGPYKRHSDAIFVEHQPGKRVCVVSKGALAMSEKTLRRVVHSYTGESLSYAAGTCLCGVINNYPNPPLYADVGGFGHNAIVASTFKNVFPYPQFMGMSTCRVPTSSPDLPRCVRPSNYCWSSKENVIVYLNNDQEIVDVHGWRYVDTLGEGSYGKVYFVRNEFTGEESAFKRMLLHKTGGMPPAILREIHSLKSLNHDNVIKLNKVYIGDCRVYLSFPRIVGGNLRQMLEKHYPNGMPLDEVKVIARQLIDGIAHIHSRCIIHRDIKPENILVHTETKTLTNGSNAPSPDKSNSKDRHIVPHGRVGSPQLDDASVKPRIKRVVITDFGLSRTHKSLDHPLFYNDDSKLMNSPMSPEVVTLCYRPPELLLGDFHYSFSVDIWSLGCVLFELITGKPIFEERTEFALLIAMFKRFGTPKEEDWPDLTSLPFMNPSLPKMKTKSSLFECVDKADKECMDLLERMLALSPQKRITAREALHHPWISSC